MSNDGEADIIETVSKTDVMKIIANNCGYHAEVVTGLILKLETFTNIKRKQVNYPNDVHCILTDKSP